MIDFDIADADAARALLRASLEYLVVADGYPREDLGRLCDDEIRDLYEDVDVSANETPALPLADVETEASGG